MREIVDILSKEERKFFQSEGHKPESVRIENMSVKELMELETDIAVSLDPEMNKEEVLDIVEALFHSNVKRVFIGVKLHNTKSARYINTLQEMRKIASEKKLEFVHYNYAPCRIGMVYGKVDKSLASPLAVTEEEEVYVPPVEETIDPELEIVEDLSEMLGSEEEPVEESEPEEKPKKKKKSGRKSKKSK